MDVLEAVSSRYSCRAFLPTPIPEKIVREIVERAARAPSAGNMQPWRVYAIAGKRVEELKASLAPRMATELPKGEGTDYTIYPRTADRAISGTAVHGWRTTLSVNQGVARRQVCALQAVYAINSSERRSHYSSPAKKPMDRRSGRTSVAFFKRLPCWRRLRFAYLSTTSLGLVSPHRAHVP